MLPLLTAPTGAISAYDCENPDNPVATINLQEPGPCAEAAHQFEEARVVEGQVAQTHTAGSLKVTRCKVVNTRQATRCGFTSISYGSVYTAWEETIPISARDCLAAVTTRFLKIDNYPIPIIKDQKTTKTYYPYGGIDTKGNCRNTAFTDRYQYFPAHYLRVSVTAMIEEWTIPMDPFQTYTKLGNTGLKVKTGDGYIHDNRQGTFVYQRQKDTACETGVSGIYQGNMTLFQKKKTVEGSYIAIQNHTTGQVVGARLGAKKVICGHACHETQIEDLVICDVDFNGVGRDWSTFAFEFQSHFPQDAIGLMSQLGYTALARTREVDQMITGIKEDLCRVERLALHNKLQAAAAGNKYAFLDQFGEGIQLYIAGSVAYVIRCEEVEVQRTSYTNCTSEIPVVYDNHTWFADPITYILQRHPTPMPCSPSMPVRWKLNDHWWCSHPVLAQCTAPAMLETTIKPHMLRDDWIHAAGSREQVYSAEERDQHRLAVAEMLTRVPLSTVMAKRLGSSMAYDMGGVSQMGLPLSEADIDQLMSILGHRYFLFFRWFGDVWLYFLGFCLVITMVKMLTGLLARACLLYRVRGCGLWMLVAGWDSCFSIFGLPIRTAKLIFQAGEDLEAMIAERQQGFVEEDGHRREEGHDPRTISLSREDDAPRAALRDEEDECGYIKLIPSRRSGHFRAMSVDRKTIPGWQDMPSHSSSKVTTTMQDDQPPCYNAPLTIALDRNPTLRISSYPAVPEEDETPTPLVSVAGPPPPPPPPPSARGRGPYAHF